MCKFPGFGGFRYSFWPGSGEYDEQRHADMDLLVEGLILQQLPPFYFRTLDNPMEYEWSG